MLALRGRPRARGARLGPCGAQQKSKGSRGRKRAALLNGFWMRFGRFGWQVVGQRCLRGHARGVCSPRGGNGRRLYVWKNGRKKGVRACSSVQEKEVGRMR